MQRRLVGIMMASALLMMGSLVAGHTQAAEAPKTAATPQKPDGKPGRAVETLGNEHVASPSTPHVPYNTAPPTSGPHLQWVAKWGVHKAPIVRELQVHNLEDGGVIVQYKCDQPCPDLVAKLEALAARYRDKAEADRASMPRPATPDRPLRSKYDHLIVAPYPDMQHQIALTAWGRIDSFDGYDEDRIVRFIEAFIGIDHHPAHEKAPAAQKP
ncbi:MAG: DUF3105 domain-containing protein [Nitrospirota bacterium]